MESLSWTKLGMKELERQRELSGEEAQDRVKKYRPHIKVGKDAEEEVYFV